MGATEQLNGPHSGKSESDAKERQDQPSAAAEPSPGQRPASVPPSQGMVRRSSLRPAPADYVPSVRDPSTLRPMMVVRAGDVESIEGHSPVSSRGVDQTQRPPPSSANPQGVGATAAQVADGDPKLVIPSAPPVPADLVPKSTRSAHEQDRAALVANQSGPGGVASQSAVVATEFGRDSGPAQSVHAAVQPEPGAADAAQVTSAAGPKRSRRQILTVALIGVAVVGAIIALQARKPQGTPQDTDALARVAPLPQLAASAAAGAEPSPNASGDELPIAPNAAEQVRAQPESTPPEATPSALPGTTRVRLEIKPVDAKVIHRGREVPGPPFEFDVAKGQKIAVEVVRFGFTTAKVVIDDKKPVVSFGMLRTRYKR